MTSYQDSWANFFLNRCVNTISQNVRAKSDWMATASFASIFRGEEEKMSTETQGGHAGIHNT
jgi:hypothetical protein